jgi:hypothetical protein
MLSKRKQSHINHLFLSPSKNSILLVSMRQKEGKFITQTSQVDDIEYIFTVSWNFKKFIFLIKNFVVGGEVLIWDEKRGEKMPRKLVLP